MNTYVIRTAHTRGNGFVSLWVWLASRMNNLSNVAASGVHSASPFLFAVADRCSEPGLGDETRDHGRG